MGKDNYFGVFVSCKQKLISKTVDMKCCEDYNCRSYNIHIANHSSMYCDRCGNKLFNGNKEIKTVNINAQDDIRNISNLIFLETNSDKSYKYDIWTPSFYNAALVFNNTYIFGEFFVFGDKENVLGANEKSINKSINCLSKHYAEDISKLKKIYGSKNVKINFGLIVDTDIPIK